MVESCLIKQHQSWLGLLVFNFSLHCQSSAHRSLCNPSDLQQNVFCNICVRLLLVLLWGFVFIYHTCTFHPKSQRMFRNWWTSLFLCSFTALTSSINLPPGESCVTRNPWVLLYSKLHQWQDYDFVTGAIYCKFIRNFAELPLAETILRNSMQSHIGCSVGQLGDSFIPQWSEIPWEA